MNPPIKNNIKIYRKAAAIGQQELADKLDINRSYLSKLENQYYSPGPQLMYKICKALDRQLGEVFFIQ